MTMELLKWIAASICFMTAAVSALAYWLLPVSEAEKKAAACAQEEQPRAAQPQLRVVEGGCQPPRHCA